MCLLLQEKLVLVIGAGSSFGQKICCALAEEGAVVVTDYNVETSLNTLPVEQHISAILEETNIYSLFNKIQSNFTQPISLLINCIDIIEDSITRGITIEQFQEILKLYLVKMLAVIREASEALIKRDMPGSIINVINMNGTSTATGRIFYTVVKTAVDTLTESVAQEIAEYNIQCVVTSFETEETSQLGNPYNSTFNNMSFYDEIEMKNLIEYLALQINHY